MLEQVQEVFAQLPEMDQLVLSGMFNPNAELSPEGERLKEIISQLTVEEQIIAVGGTASAAPDMMPAMPEDAVIEEEIPLA